MIRLNLEIADPSRTDAPKLRALAVLFTALADGTATELDKLRDTVGADKIGFRQQTVIGGQEVGALAAADNPAAGIPTPSEAFGAGNGAAGSGSAQTGAALPAGQSEAATVAGLPDPATAFGGAAVPNAPGGAIAGTPAPVPASASIPPAPLPVPPAAAAPAGVELDADGLPWDPRINSTSSDGGHPKKQDGTWKVKRGTGETYLKEVQAQLRAALAAGAGNAGVPATPPGNALPPPPPAGVSAPGNAPAPAAGATNSPPALPPTTPGAGACNTMAQLLPRVTAAITGGKLTAEQAAGIASQISGGQVNNVAMLAVAPALIPAFSAQLDALGIA